MTIGEKNIVKRWSMMASKDLGFDRNPEARGFAELFSSIFEHDHTQPCFQTSEHPGKSRSFCLPRSTHCHRRTPLLHASICKAKPSQENPPDQRADLSPKTDQSAFSAI